jgi:sulfate transporter 1, high-affinity
VNHIKKGINPSSAHKIFFTGPFVLKGFKIGVVCGMIGLTVCTTNPSWSSLSCAFPDCTTIFELIIYQEAVAIGRTFAALKDYQLDGNKEMVALGTMNVVGSMTSCYIATGSYVNFAGYSSGKQYLIIQSYNLFAAFISGSFSRSAVNFMAGCKTPVSNVVMSTVVLLTLLVITPLFKYTPNAILGSIIISAVIGLVDYEAAILICKVDKMDFIACMGAFFGVVFASVEIGLLIAVRTHPSFDYQITVAEG